MDLIQKNNNTKSVDLTPFLLDIANNRSRYSLPFALGMDENNNKLLYGLEKCPHLLVAGTTGSGKSVFLHNVIMSAMFANSSIVLIDIKRVEFSIYEKNKCLSLPIAYNVKDAIWTLKSVSLEMEKRYKTFESFNCRNIQEYNEKVTEKMSYITVVIDELADLVLQSKAIERELIHLAQLARAAGIHLVVATQRPDSQILNGLIRANFPSRICFRVQSASNSKIILDKTGGEYLAGNGDGLALFSGFNDLIRFQSPIINKKDLEEIITKTKRN